jgi:hypothetical protein
LKSHIQRLRRATWSCRQPLTRVPAIAGAPVSDLFIWRNSDEWESFFELTDLPALFAGPDNVGGHATLVFFDAAGQPFLEHTVEITRCRRNTLVLSDIIGKKRGSVGTFCVFHPYTPQCLQSLGSHIAERGYVSYRYLGAPLRAYVHGNMDAIARLPDRSLQLLGGQSIRRREYNLHLSLCTHGYYELAFVNPTPNTQRIVCRTLSLSGKLIFSQTAHLSPRGSHLFIVVTEYAQQRIVISSRLIMARPLVFVNQNQTIDVFHG